MKKESKLILIILILFVAACNKTGDPVFASTYLGGNGHEFCEAIALDDDGNIYVAGNTRSLDFPTTEGAYNRNPNGKSDVFIAKFDNDLETLLASTPSSVATETNVPIPCCSIPRAMFTLRVIHPRKTSRRQLMLMIKIITAVTVMLLY